MRVFIFFFWMELFQATSLDNSDSSSLKLEFYSLTEHANTGSQVAHQQDVLFKHRISNVQNNVKLREKSRRKLRSVTENLGAITCERKKEFNLTSVLEMGMAFQTEFCSLTCKKNLTSVNDNLAKFMSIHPSCALCKCDDNCWLYGSCCDVQQINEMPSNITYHTKVIDHQRFHCFPIHQNVSVYIIASCPDKAATFDEKLHEAGRRVSEVPDSDSRCSSCLSTPGSAKLITSLTSGWTYCNSYCLRCNEGRSVADSDVKWREEMLCSAQTRRLQNLTSSSERNNHSEISFASYNETEEIQTHCSISYEKPAHVNITECDKKLMRPIIKNCHPDIASNMSSETYERLENLCSDYYFPVYTEFEEYQNIFCYICQGKIPAECTMINQYDRAASDKEIFDLSLSLLTDMSDLLDDRETDNRLDVSIHRDFTVKEAENNSQIVVELKNLTCPDGYWTDERKGVCRKISCVSGRNISGDATSDPYCHLSETDLGRDVYKLNLVWCVIANNQLLDLESVIEDNDDSSIVKEVSKNTEINNYNTMLPSEVFLNNDNTKVQARQGISKDNDDSGESSAVNARNDKFSEHRERHFNRKLNIVHQCSDKAANISIKNSIPRVSIDNQSGSPTEGASLKVINSQRIWRLKLIKLIQQYIRTTLNLLDAKRYYFQLYPCKTDSVIWQERQLNEKEFYFHSDSAKNLILQAVVYIHFNSGGNRQEFEKNLVKYFVGTRDLTDGSSVVTVDQTLVSSDDIHLVETREIYHSDLQNGGCCLVVEPYKQKELFREALSLDNNRRVISFNAVTTCPHVAFNISDFNVSLLLDRSRYILDNLTLYVCYNSLNPHIQNHFTPFAVSIENILTLISIGLSLVCLLIIFLTYSLFHTLRSLPGKNNMVMVFWLFFAQLLLLLSSLPYKYSKLCTAVGIFLHYSWLSTICWTCACSFHMFHVFVHRRGAPSSRKSHMFYITRYILVSNAFATFDVGSVILTSLYFSEGRNPGYGGHICYLNSALLVGVAFVLPLACILLVNCTLFSLTIYTISRIDEVRRLCGRERTNVHIYFRLSSLTGLCWILALLAEIPGLQPLRTISVFVNGCQGVTLFLSYVCNRRVVRMWCNLLKSKSSGFNRSSLVFSKQTTVSSSL